jgi:tricorn protease-like protein
MHRRASGVLLILLLYAFNALSQSLPPSTDIYLAPISVTAGRLEVGMPMNITARKGYDNQPSFLPDGSGILYTAIQTNPSGPQAPTQTDIFQYDIASQTTLRITATPESEYSATVTPNRESFSVIRVEPDSTQRLWQFKLDGTYPSLALADIKPVGYHAWVDDSTLALFVLGNPPTLRIASVKTGRSEIVARGIGRSIHKVPGVHAVSFVHKVSQEEWWITMLDVRTGATERVVRTLAGSEDYSWTPEGLVVMGQGSKLFAYRPGQGLEWREIADLSANGLGTITRLAVSPDGRWLAVVAPEPESK